jgi:hypothetical protein
MTDPQEEPTMSTAVDEIFNRLETYWTDDIGHVAVATMSKQVWLDLPINPDTIGGRYGWTWPGLNPDVAEHPDHPYIVGYCPEIIAEITAHLEPEDREEYLRGLMWSWGDFLEKMEHGTEGLADAIRDRVCAHVPFTGNLMNEVEARAVRVGLVPAEVGGEISADLTCPATGCGYTSPAGTHNCPLCDTPL